MEAKQATLHKQISTLLHQPLCSPVPGWVDILPIAWKGTRNTLALNQEEGDIRHTFPPDQATTLHRSLLPKAALGSPRTRHRQRHGPLAPSDAALVNVTSQTQNAQATITSTSTGGSSPITVTYMVSW